MCHRTKFVCRISHIMNCSFQWTLWTIANIKAWTQKPCPTASVIDKVNIIFLCYTQHKHIGIKAAGRRVQNDKVKTCLFRPSCNPINSKLFISHFHSVHENIASVNVCQKNFPLFFGIKHKFLLIYIRKVSLVCVYNKSNSPFV